MKYEQEDLLEKFIRNERRSKMWALISAIAFTLVSVSVVYVAKEVKGGSTIVKGTSDVTKTDTIIKIDTFWRTVNDKEQITRIIDSFAKVQHEKEIVYKQCDADNKNLKDEIEKLKIVYQQCNDKNTILYKQIVQLQDRLKACESKPVVGTPPAGPVVKPINVVISYTARITDSTVLKLEKLLSRSKVKMNVSHTKVTQGLKPLIMYYSKDDEETAKYIATIINNSSSFGTRYKYSTYLNTNGSKPAGNIDIMLMLPIIIE